MIGAQLMSPFEPIGGYLFWGDEFPRIRWQQPWLAAQVWGQPLPELQVRWFDASGTRVDQPEGFGRYTAVVDAPLPGNQRVRRGLTLFRIKLAALSQGADRFPFSPDESPGFGLSPGLWQSESELLTEFVRQATFDRLLKEPAGAIVIAALAEANQELDGIDAATHPAHPLARPHERHRRHGLAVRQQLDPGAAAARAELERPRPSPTPAPALGMDEQEPTLAGFTDEVIPALEALCQAWLRDAELPFTLVVARNGHVVFHRSYGEWQDKPVTQDTSYPLFSLSKSVTGIMTGLMLDADLLDLDEPLSAILTGLNKPAANPATPPITVRRCLMHVTGLKGHPDWSGLENPWLDEVIGDAYAIDHVQPHHQYSGTSYDLVGLAMEHRTGQTIEHLFERHLFGPLAMKNARIDNLGSGIHLRAIDLARLGQLLLNQGRYGDAEFFTPATFEELLPRSYAELFPEIDAGDRRDYGLGLYWRTETGQGEHSDRPLPSPRTLGHGSFSGCLFRADLAHQMVVAMGRFQSGPEHSESVRHLLELLIDHMTGE